MNEVAKTRETYELIAADYAEARRDRSSIADTVERFVQLTKPDGLFFDVGCGPGFDTAVLQEKGLHTIGLDYSLAMLLAGRKQLGFQNKCAQGDMRQLPLPSNCADGLWVCASLLHIPRQDVPNTLAEFGRVLKEGGVLLTAVKKGEGETWDQTSYGHDAPRFFTFWQSDQFDYALEQAGLSIIDDRSNQSEDSHWLIRFSRLNCA